MNPILAITSTGSGLPHALMAAEALQMTAAKMGHALRVENPGALLSREEIAQAGVIIVATDVRVDTGRFTGKPVYTTRTSEAICHTQSVITAALKLVAVRNGAAPSIAKEAPSAPILAPVEPVIVKRFVAITSCPTGIAHTFMAAEALQKAAKALGHIIKVETQGSVGAKNQITPEEVAQADAVIIAADTNVDTSRFTGKPLYSTSTKHAMRAGKEVIAEALKVKAPQAGAGASHADQVAADKAARSKQRTGVYKHLMTGVSHMLPVVIAGGLCIALAFALGGIYAGKEQGTLAAALSQIGGGTAFHLFVAVLSGFIAYSIADRPGIAPGLIGGMLAQELGAGFLGGIVSGFLAGYLTKFLADKIRLPATLEGLKPVLILPFLSTVVVGLMMIYVIAPPVHYILTAVTDWLQAMQGTNAIVLGLLLGGMMAFDMGGPINKSAYTFAVGLLASQVYTPMAAVMAAGMVPPLGIALAVYLFRNRFDEEEREASSAAFVLGLSFITEGAIPFAAKDPLRVIPPLVLGAAVTGAISMFVGVQLLVPHGGAFALLIPGAVTHLLAYLTAIVAGTVVTALALGLVKRPLKQL